MRFAIVGSGAVGGYYGAKLQRAGHDVTLIARGKNLAALREKGMTIESAALGDFHVKPRAEESAANVRGTEVVLLATKTYDNDTAIPLVRQLLDQGASGAYVLSLQNGVSSPYALAEAVGEARVMAGPTYVATALVEPGRIVQTGVHRRIAFGEVFKIGAGLSARALALHDAFVGADIVSEPHPDGRVPLWQKYTYLGPFAAFTGAARLPIGPLWADPGTRESFLAASREMHSLASAEGSRSPPTPSPNSRLTSARCSPTPGPPCSSICSRARGSRSRACSVSRSAWARSMACPRPSSRPCTRCSSPGPTVPDRNQARPTPAPPSTARAMPVR